MSVTNFTQFQRALAMASAFALGTAPMALAQAAGAVYTVTVPSAQFGSSAYLSHVLGSLSATQAFCAALSDPALNVDCLAERLGQVAKQIPNGSNYSDLRDVLDQTSKDLNQLARTNRDRDRGTIKATPRTTGADLASQPTSRPLNPVKTESIAAVNAKAAQILDDAQTVLLRSAETGSIKAGQYSRIAKAIDSNKVLLRST